MSSYPKYEIDVYDVNNDCYRDRPLKCISIYSVHADGLVDCGEQYCHC